MATMTGTGGAGDGKQPGGGKRAREEEPEDGRDDILAALRRQIKLNVRRLGDNLPNNRKALRNYVNTTLTFKGSKLKDTTLDIRALLALLVEENHRHKQYSTWKKVLMAQELTRIIIEMNPAVADDDDDDDDHPGHHESGPGH
jgi:hypothetical protein